MPYDGEETRNNDAAATNRPDTGSDGGYTPARYEGYTQTDYDEPTLTDTIRRRPLPALPPQPSAPPAHYAGQLDTMGPAGHEIEPTTSALRNLSVNAPIKDKGTESFVLRQLPLFDGSYDGEKVGEWIERVQLLREVSGIADADLIRLLPLRMSTRAADFLMELLQKLQAHELTWKNIKTALLRQYGGTADPTKLLSKLQSMKKERDVPVREYAYEIERLARLAYPELCSDNAGPAQREVQKSIFNRITVEQFVSGLPPLLSRAIMEKKIDDFQEAVQMAAHLEEVNARFLKRNTINALNSTDAEEHQQSSAREMALPSFHDQAYNPQRFTSQPYREAQPYGMAPRTFYPHVPFSPRFYRPQGLRGGRMGRPNGATVPGTERYPSNHHYRRGSYQPARGGYQQAPSYQSRTRYAVPPQPTTRGEQAMAWYQHETARISNPLRCFRCDSPDHLVKSCPVCPTCLGYNRHHAGCPSVICSYGRQENNHTTWTPKNFQGRPTGRRIN